MDRDEALNVIAGLSKEDFEERIKPQKLPKDRQDLLFSFMQGEIQVSYACKPDIEDYALKSLIPEIYEILPHEGHPYSTCDNYEYDPPKNGQNIIKHGIGFGEVVSYSNQFGRLMVPVPNNNEENDERLVIFSNLNLVPSINRLQMPLDSIEAKKYSVMSVTHYRDKKFRFITAKILSSTREKYRRAIAQTLRDIGQEKQSFVDHCVEVLERDLMQLLTANETLPKE